MGVRRVLGVVGLVGLLGGAGSGAFWGARWVFPPARELPGTSIGGKLPGRAESLRAWLERRREVLADEEVFVTAHGATYALTRRRLGIELDVDATEQAAVDAARRGSLGARLERARRARSEGAELDPYFAFDRERARESVRALLQELHREPVDARLDVDRRQRIAEVPGAELDVDATLALIETGDRGELPVFPAVLRAIPARVTTAMLSDVDVSSVLSSYETDFKGSPEGRQINIARAAKYLDGIVLAPGQSLSFNGAVGPRTFERGFALAPVIIDDELDSGIGGGVCQVASTLHAAAVFGGFEVPRRRSHSRPSAYTQLGLDATVIYGEVDLEIRNPYDTPILIHASRPSVTRLRIELIGRSLPGKIEYGFGVARTHEFYRRVTTKPWLGERQLRRQRGRRGLDVVSSVRFVHADGKVEQRSYYSEYRPVPEVWWVGPEHDGASLPDLPEGAERTEVNGVPQSSGVFLGSVPTSVPDDPGT
jgi:vancomycin resistance protein YoaR